MRTGIYFVLLNLGISLTRRDARKSKSIPEAIPDRDVEWFVPSVG